jgi:catechol 2,3-dioxygenase-like lactoylglutathione lyase family enzyme
MLGQARFQATIPAVDLQRARSFYAKLGLEPSEEGDQGLTYKSQDGSSFLLFQSSGTASGTHTQMGFDVKDLDAEVTELRNKGVKFEEYDLPGFKSVNGIVQIEGTRAAWFKDSEGNLIAVGELVPAGVR